VNYFYNGHFWIGNAFDEDVRGILCEKGKIKDIVYQDCDLDNNLFGIDLHGAYVFPGFIDTHTHSFEGGLYSLMIDLSSARNLEDVFTMIAEGSVDKGNCVFAWNFDERKITEGRFPTKAELDKVVPDKNLVLRRIDGHCCIINTFAFNNITRTIRKAFCEDDILKGVENDKAVHWFHSNLDNELILRSYQSASQIALKGGFGTVHTMVGDADMSMGHYDLLEKHLFELAVDYVLYPQSFNIEAALDLGATRIGGCILADGSIGSLTAAFFQPYQGRPVFGTLYQSDQFWYDFISKAHNHNLQVGVHCIGDRAISQINNVYLKLAQEDYRDLRHQLIHCEVTDNNLLSQIQDSTAIPVMQPAFDMLWGGDKGFYAQMLGPERSRSMNRFKSMMNLGISITGSSDWYITELDIRKSLYAAMNHHNPHERLSLAEAVQIYSSNAARLSHDEHRWGEIKKGMDADFTMLNYIPSAKEPDLAQKVVMVVKKEQVLYENMSD